MFYRVTGTIKATIYENCSCEFCQGHIRIRKTHVTVDVEAQTTQEAEGEAAFQVAKERGYEDCEWDGEPEISEVPQDVIMLRIGAPTLFDLSKL